jgi:predicted N-acyltransferase
MNVIEQSQTFEKMSFKSFNGLLIEKSKERKRKRKKERKKKERKGK